MMKCEITKDSPIPCLATCFLLSFSRWISDTMVLSCTSGLWHALHCASNLFTGKYGSSYSENFSLLWCIYLSKLVANVLLWVLVGFKNILGKMLANILKYFLWISLIEDWGKKGSRILFPDSVICMLKGTAHQLSLCFFCTISAKYLQIRESCATFFNLVWNFSNFGPTKLSFLT